jgi:glycosyltransferase involved in cell wall biosynthesis
LKVAFDEQVFLLQQYGGISRYLCNLAEGLSRMPDVTVQVSAPFHINHNLAQLNDVIGARCFLPDLNTKFARPVRALSQLLSGVAVRRFRPDILHATYYGQSRRLSGARHVLTVYDLIHERYSDMFENSHMTSGPKKAAALRADHVVCISESTRRDLINICGVPEEKTSVIYLGADTSFFDTKPVANLIERPYLLYVGKRDGYKNFEGLLRAFAISYRLKSTFDIVCFGGDAFTETELSLMRTLGLRSKQFKHVSGSDQKLSGLYRGAQVFVYPSLYEGFGIPPLEAMAAACPVCCSNTSSIPEVVGDAGEYFDPTSPESMTVAMEAVAFSETRRTNLITLGKKQISKFSWQKCAQETELLYRKLL